MTKQFYIYYFIALFAAISCSKEPTNINIHSGDAISFNAIDTASSKENLPASKSLIKNDFEEGNSIGVYGYFLDDGEWNSYSTSAAANETPNFMYNQAVTCDDVGAWSYSPVKFWSNDDTDRYKFFGYYPHNHEYITPSPNNLSGYPYIDFDMDHLNPLDNQADLLYAQTEVIAKNESQVDLNFSHALSKIRVSARIAEIDTENQTSVKIKSITFNDAYTKGRLAHSISAIGASWQALDDKQDFVIDQYTPAGTSPPTHGKTIGLDPVMLVGNGDGSDALLMIPRNEKIEITITYDFSHVIKGETHTLVNETIVAQIDDEWLQGSAYYYDLVIGTDALKIDVNSEVSDWGASFDIGTAVKYTYLYVEKPEYTLNITKEGLVELGIDFSTNADFENNNVSATIIDSKDPRNNVKIEIVNSSDVQNDAGIVKCQFYMTIEDPSTPQEEFYSQQVISIKAGIISTKVTVNFVPVEEYDLSNKLHVDMLLGITSSELITSNSYFINPSPTYARKYVIPITKQIQHLNPSSTVLADNTWEINVFAYDNSFSVNQMTFLKEEDRNGLDCFSVTVPKGYDNYGNIILTIVDPTQIDASGNKTILWTWHLWVTDYDPYSLISEGFKIESGNVIRYTSTSYPGSVYRHKIYDYSYVIDRNIGAVDNDFVGHGGLGGRGWLAYQYGRVMPIFGHTAKFGDGSLYVTQRESVESVVQQISQKESIQNPSTIYYSQAEVPWCSDGGSSTVWHDLTLVAPTVATTAKDGDDYKKSIYDPSPLGFMVPPSTEYSLSGWTTVNRGLLYTMSSGNPFYATINIDPQTGVTNLAITSFFQLWTNSNYGSDGGGSMRFGTYTGTATSTGVESVTYDNEAPYTYGSSIRPIFQFKVTDTP